MGKAIVITSGKGGTGKTTAVSALSCCLASMGYKTLCLDGDMGLKNLDICLGLSDLAVMDFSDIIEGHSSPEKAIVAHPKINNLYFLTAPVYIAHDSISPEDMKNLIESLKSQYDFILIDSPAGIGMGFQLSVCGADSALVIATTDTTSYRDAARVVIELMEQGLDDIRLIVNRIRPSLLKSMKSTIDDAVDSVGVQLIGIVPEDKAIILSSNAGIPLTAFNRKSKGALDAFMRISQRLAGQKVAINKIRKYI
ncbi:MAG: septum site-determining protein MinD [Clostridiales bacterium]|jgi:septum site-determining protein MinD|nr:septum site-determining protein MinD [Clostridiales bacterium]